MVDRYKAEAMLILVRDRLSNKKNPPERRVTRPLKLWQSRNKTIYAIRISVEGERKYWPTS